MDRFSALQSFIRVVDSGSFSQAARESGLGQPAVSKQMAALEAHLGTQLLHRTSRGLRPTAAGNGLYDAAVKLLGDYEEAENRIVRGGASPAGLVRVATPPALSHMYLIPRLPAFFARHPDVALDLSSSERHVDLLKEGLDLALRVGRLGDSGLVARRIGSMHTVTLATPHYLAQHGTPQVPDDLHAHRLVAWQYQGGTVPWRFKGTGKGSAGFEPAAVFRCNDGGDLRAAVLAGLGIGHSASALFHEDLLQGRLVRLLAAHAPPPQPVHVVHPGGRRLPRRVGVVIDFLAEAFATEPGLVAR